MASRKEYLEFIFDQLSYLDDIRYVPMMGEYILYYKDKIIGGIYDDRFLVKITKSSTSLMPEAEEDIPYDGAKPMILVDNVDDKEFLKDLIEAMWGELPFKKKKVGNKS
ncbi:MAG: competence protein TfoX [Bacilli bacterium]|nr:competence protein TfoX [Bacilli bacterium]